MMATTNYAAYMQKDNQKRAAGIAPAARPAGLITGYFFYAHHFKTVFDRNGK